MAIGSFKSFKIIKIKFFFHQILKEVKIDTNIMSLESILELFIKKKKEKN